MSIVHCAAFFCHFHLIATPYTQTSCGLCAKLPYTLKCWFKKGKKVNYNGWTIRLFDTISRHRKAENSEVHPTQV